MTTDETTKRGPGRPPGPVTDTERYRSHTDAERGVARAKLRSVARSWDEARAKFEKADRARLVAIVQAYATGINDPEIGRVLSPERPVHAGHVGRQRARAHKQGIAE